MINGLKNSRLVDRRWSDRKPHRRVTKTIGWRHRSPKPLIHVMKRWDENNEHRLTLYSEHLSSFVDSPKTLRWKFLCQTKWHKQILPGSNTFYLVRNNLIFRIKSWSKSHGNWSIKFALLPWSLFRLTSHQTILRVPDLWVLILTFPLNGRKTEGAWC